MKDVGFKEIFSVNDHAIFKVPFDFNNDETYQDYIFDGGLYAVVSHSMADGNFKKAMLEKWILESGIFEIDINENNLSRQVMSECTTDYETMQKYMELADLYIPIKYRDEYKEFILQDCKLLKVEILSSDKIKIKDLIIDEYIENNVSNSEITIKCPNDFNFVKTPLRYKLPIKIDMIAKVDSSNLRIGFGKAQIIFNWEFDYDNLCYSDPYSSNIKIDNIGKCNGGYRKIS